MGIGGGFIMVPAMIYILRMPTAAVVGTSLFQVLCVTVFTTFCRPGSTRRSMSCSRSCSWSAASSACSMAAGWARGWLRPVLRFLIALLIVGMALRLAIELIAPPADLYSIAPPEEAR